MATKKAKKTTVSAVVQPRTAAAMAEWAALTGRTRSHVADTAIRFYLEACLEASARLKKRAKSHGFSSAEFAAELSRVRDEQIDQCAAMLALEQES